MVKISCPKCMAKKVYLLSNRKRKCSLCKYEFTPHRLPLYLTRDEWREIIWWFLLEQSSQNIAIKTGLERKRVLRALTIIRTALVKDVPEIFSGTVEVDETYIGGQWKNKRKSVREQGTKRGRGTKKQPVFGILCRNGNVWAEVVDDVSAETLQPLISRKVTSGSTVCSDTWKAYTGIASRGYVHRLVDHGDKQYSDGKGNHINGLEGFWGYLKRKLVSKGGIRLMKLPLYLGEYVWRYNHRKENDNVKLICIIKLLEREV
jgi:transposase